MNCVLFHEAEWGQPLGAADPRSIHIRSILKLAVGDSLRVGLLGRGSGEARLTSTSGPIELDFPADLAPPETPLAWRLILGHVRPPVMQRLFRDLAAVGIAEIGVVNAGLTEQSYFKSSFWAAQEFEHWLFQGAMQGGNVVLPRVRRYWSVAAAAAALQAESGHGWLCEPGAHHPSLLTLLNQPSQGGLTTVAVGPERGWTADEVDSFLKAGLRPASLGRRVLRTEQVAQAIGVLAAMSDHG